MQSEPKSNFFRDFLIIVAILSLFVILIIGCGILIYKNFTRQATKPEKSLLESAKPGSVKTDPVISKPEPVPPLPEPDKSPAASQDLAIDEPKAEKSEKWFDC